MFPGMILSNALITVSLCWMPLVLIFDFPFVGYSSQTQLRTLLFHALLAHGSYLLNELVLWIEVGFRNGMRETEAVFWTAPCKFSRRIHEPPC